MTARAAGREVENPMARTSPFQFLQQVRAEGAKVTWPTRRETLITSAMVFVMVILASVFFLVVDQLIRWGLGLLLGR
jgi:preprotein translocase subunit SecE